jgi:protein-S-isoprenylcysteine O-methyltransferase Ste14
VLRHGVRKEYQEHGRLRTAVSLLQLLIFVAYFGFLAFFNPQSWAWFWQYNGQTPAVLFYGGLILICLGFIIAFGTMAWFGIGKAFGLRAEGLTKTGPYQFSRNPQIIGGYFLVVGTFMQWPSWYAAGWVLIWVLIARWMIASEEEHLRRVFGDEYVGYCSEVPRYVIWGSKT